MITIAQMQYLSCVFAVASISRAKTFWGQDSEPIAVEQVLTPTKVLDVFVVCCVGKPLILKSKKTLEHLNLRLK